MGNSILNILMGMVVSQAFGGIIFLLAFIPMIRKFMNVEVPAMITDVHKDFDGLKAEFKELNTNFNRLSLSLERVTADFEARLRSLERNSPTTFSPSRRGK